MVRALQNPEIRVGSRFVRVGRFGVVTPASQWRKDGVRCIPISLQIWGLQYHTLSAPN